MTDSLHAQIIARLVQSQHPNSIAAELGIDPLIVFSTFVQWRRK